MTITLPETAKAVLTKAYEAPGYPNGYQALKAQLSPGNKAKLRNLCDTDSFISDRDLIYAIINCIAPTNDGLDLGL
jgi:hypothetical protein